MHEQVRQPVELNQLLGRNRLRMAFIVSAFTLISAGVSFLGIYAVYRAFDLGVDLWVVLVVFWGAMIIFSVLRFALGWGWLFKKFVADPVGGADLHLREALDAARLAAGMEQKIRLMVIPDDDVNAFSLAMPDGSFAVMAARGVAEKLPARAREAMMAHEIGHIQAGDTTLQTVYLCLMGKHRLAHRPGRDGKRRRGSAAGALLTLIAFAFITGSVFRTAESVGVSNDWLAAVLLAAFFVSLIILLPELMHPLFRLALDREREYSADLLAAYHLRDPLAVYQAVEGAMRDVTAVILLPPYLDALLFCPVVDYVSYKPFRTQPTMAERMQRLREEFPALDCELRG